MRSKEAVLLVSVWRIHHHCSYGHRFKQRSKLQRRLAWSLKRNDTVRSSAFSSDLWVPALVRQAQRQLQVRRNDVILTSQFSHRPTFKGLRKRVIWRKWNRTSRRDSGHAERADFFSVSKTAACQYHRQPSPLCSVSSNAARWHTAKLQFTDLLASVWVLEMYCMVFKSTIPTIREIQKSALLQGALPMTAAKLVFGRQGNPEQLLSLDTA